MDDNEANGIHWIQPYLMEYDLITICIYLLHTYMKTQFEATFPDYLFCDLQQQCLQKQTGDARIHFRHKGTDQIFSWHICSRQWFLSDSETQSFLRLQLSWLV